MTSNSPTALTRELHQSYGPYTPLAVAWRWLSFASLDAARRAHLRGTTPISMQRLPHRRGLFVVSNDLAAWLSARGVESLAPSAPDLTGRTQPLS